MSFGDWCAVWTTVCKRERERKRKHSYLLNDLTAPCRAVVPAAPAPGSPETPDAADQAENAAPDIGSADVVAATAPGSSTGFAVVHAATAPEMQHVETTLEVAGAAAAVAATGAVGRPQTPQM